METEKALLFRIRVEIGVKISGKGQLLFLRLLFIVQSTFSQPLLLIYLHHPYIIAKQPIHEDTTV